tara:strand:+ start:147 stop:743 length:597 start_codon:yes stop_codon:yes gene_type:complete
MIKFENLNLEAPYIKFKELYDKSSRLEQKNIEAICIGSLSSKKKEVNSRYVNLKLIDGNEFIFFSNYNSPKSIEFSSHNQISALIYWNNINTQIRMKALIKKTNKEFNQTYFSTRDIRKNALAISSNQSEYIEHYDNVKKNYKRSLKEDNLTECPEYWGGFSFIPYYFEFWEGHNSRINKREAFNMIDGNWRHSFLQP